MKLSIGMMVKNEEANLPRCLESLKPLMRQIDSELIIVDTGSTDRTVEIARTYTDKTYHHPWENDYAKMRNYTLSYAKGDWFMFIDADEELVNPGPIVKFLNGKDSKTHNAATVEVKSFYMSDDESMFSYSAMPRIFKRSKDLEFEGVIHEQPKYKLPLFVSTAVFNHYGYVGDDPALKKHKLEAYEPILLKAIEEEPQNIYYWHQLSRTYSSYKSHESALDSAEKAYSIVKEQKQPARNFLYAYGNLAYLYILNKKEKEAIVIADQGLNLENSYLDLWFYKAKAHFALEEKEQALESYKKYLFYLKKQDQARDLSIINYTSSLKEDALLDTAMLYKDLKNVGEALNALREISSPQFIKKAINQGTDIFFELKDLSVLEEFYGKAKKEGAPEIVNYLHIAIENRMTKEKGDYGRVYSYFAKEDTPYGLLNKVRLADAPIQDIKVAKALQELDFNELDSYYGDIIYFMVINQWPLDVIDLAINEEKLERIFQYIEAKYGDLSVLYLNYIKACKTGNGTEAGRIIKNMARQAAFTNNFNDEEYKYIFNRYVDEGIACLNYVYSGQLLSEKKSHLLKNREDIFFLHMNMAKTNKQTNKKEYLKNIKEALKALPETRRGIELLTRELTDEIEAKPATPSSEMEMYAQKVKQNIRLLIDQGNYRDAELFIKTFEEILPEDEEIEGLKQEIRNKVN